MRVVPARSTRSLAAAGLLAALVLAAAGGSSARAPGCDSFETQAGAQGRFFALGGGPRRNVGGMDDDRDGVACEQLPGPHAGYAKVGCNKRGRFFCGVAKMPASGNDFACLQGNRHFPDGPRLLRVYRVDRRGPDRPVTPDVGAAVAPGGRLVWKAEKRRVRRGRYYASFEERIPLGPFEGSRCKGFRSHPTLLPRRRTATRLPRSGPPPRR